MQRNSWRRRVAEFIALKPGGMMLKEIRQVRQIPGEPQRRWFTSESLDLIVWLDQGGQALAFQLCYDKGRTERALSWMPARGFSHLAVDDGEAGTTHYKATPILVGAGTLDAQELNDLFQKNGTCVPHDIADFINAKIQAYRTLAAI